MRPRALTDPAAVAVVGAACEASTHRGGRGVTRHTTRLVRRPAAPGAPANRPVRACIVCLPVLMATGHVLVTRPAASSTPPLPAS